MGCHEETQMENKMGLVIMGTVIFPHIPRGHHHHHYIERIPLTPENKEVIILFAIAMGLLYLISEYVLRKRSVKK